MLLLGVLVVSFIVSRILTSFITFTVVSGTSMLPTYEDKDLVVTVKQMDYKIGDPIVYQPDALSCETCHVIHRIVDGNGVDGWVTQGDNNPTTDPWRPTNDEVRGVVVAHIQVPDVLHIIYAPQLWWTIFMGILLLFFIDMFYIYWKKHQQDESFDERQEARADTLEEATLKQESGERATDKVDA